MWQWIEFTPEEERALEATEREMAERWPVERLHAEASPKKKTPRRSAPKTPLRRSTQPDPEALARHLAQVAEDTLAAGPLEVTPEYLEWLERAHHESEALVAELRKRGLLNDLEPN